MDKLTSLANLPLILLSAKYGLTHQRFLLFIFLRFLVKITVVKARITSMSMSAFAGAI